MKTKLFHLVCLLTVMAFAVSCGKEASSSGGHYSSNLELENPHDKNVVNAVNKFKQWYNSRIESQLPNPQYSGFHHIVERIGSGTSTCLVKIGSTCVIYSNSNSVSKCWVLPKTDPSRTVKDSNPILKGLYSGSLGSVVNATANVNNDLRGTYVITVRNSENKYIRYTINTNTHSSFQPYLTESLSETSYSQLYAAYPTAQLNDVEACFTN